MIEVSDVSEIKQQFKLPQELWSCHTAIVDGYIIEGHVPVEDILKILEEKPAIAGLAVPGMPVGSPGMESTTSPAEPYTVYSFDLFGNTQEFHHYP